VVSVRLFFVWSARTTLPIVRDVTVSVSGALAVQRPLSHRPLSQ